MRISIYEARDSRGLLHIHTVKGIRLSKRFSYHFFRVPFAYQVRWAAAVNPHWPVSENILQHLLTTWHRTLYINCTHCTEFWWTPLNLWPDNSQPHEHASPLGTIANATLCTCVKGTISIGYWLHDWVTPLSSIDLCMIIVDSWLCLHYCGIDPKWSASSVVLNILGRINVHGEPERWS